MFFDLGDTIIDTRDWNNQAYMPGARDFLHQLKKRGYRLGLIINMLERLGKTQRKLYAELLNLTEPYWREKAAFRYEDFDVIMMSPRDRFRKDKPYLFVEALKIAGDCGAIYMGEKRQEIDLAQKLGFSAHLIKVNWPKKQVNFPALKKVLSMFKASKSATSKACIDSFLKEK